MSVEGIKFGDRVLWCYRHHTNSTTSFIAEKHGEYQGLIRHTIKHRGPQLAVVHFDGNKRQSRVPLFQLEHETEQP